MPAPERANTPWGTPGAVAGSRSSGIRAKLAPRMSTLLPPEVYESYPEFLKLAIRAFWERDDTPRVESLALLLSAREAWGAAADQLAGATSVKGLLAGAAGATAATVLLRSLLGGPLGLVLTGASVASLLALYRRNRRHVEARISFYRRVITQYRGEFEQLTEDYLADRLKRDQRDLMVEGLHGRFLQELRTQEAELESDDAGEVGDAHSG